MRKIYILAVLALFLGGYALSAHRMETVLTEGKTILLALAPVDPRAPLMGDYMTLRYVVNNDIRKALHARKTAAEAEAMGSAVNGGIADGFAVLRIVNEPVPQAATFVRLDDGSPLQADEFLLAYKLRGREVLTAATAFYFQEGTAHQYAGARFGKFKLAADGKTLLVGLCGRAEELGIR